MERLNFSFYDPVPVAAPPNDDLELQLVWLHVIENGGKTLTRADFARAWLDHIHYMWDEYGRCRWNLRRGVPLESVGTFENPFDACMGSPIRSEIWACLFAGDPESAAHYAALDASLDHGVEGMAGEVFFAVMQSEAAGGANLTASFASALRYIPAGSATSRAIEFVQARYGEKVPAWDCWKGLLDRHGRENFTYAPLNVGLTIWALLYGEGDFEKSILLAANGGFDTDCTAATVGATLGLILGRAGIPARWADPIGESVFVGPGIIGISAPETLPELTRRTLALIGKLERQSWNGSIWEQPITGADLAGLPGTIGITPLHEVETVLWANGELPPEAKSVGGAHWTWETVDDAPREIICLARAGAKLFIDDKLVLECPPGLPYVPATHRSPKGSRARVSPGVGLHEIRVELASRDSRQEASVLLAYPNQHIAPWTVNELPSAAELQPG